MPTTRIATSQAVFAVIVVALGVEGLLFGDFAAIWEPVPQGLPGRAALAVGCALFSLGAGMGLLWRRTVGPASRGLLAVLVCWLCLWRGRDLLHAPWRAVYYEGCGELLVVVAGAWVIYAKNAGDVDRRRRGFATGERGVRAARALCGLALVAFGVAHFAYVKDTAALVPDGFPSPVVWVYFTGAAFVAAGMALLAGVASRIAANLVTLQLALFTLLVWLPVVARGSKDRSAWSELATSAVVTAGAWVVAGSYRRMP